MSIADISTPEHSALIASLCPLHTSDTLQLSQKLRSDGYTPTVAAEILTQALLRTRGLEKFPPEHVHNMLFTRDGFEQATRFSVGEYHAQRFLDSGSTHIIDFGCCIGADSLAFASRGLRVTAIEVDAQAAAAARWNLRHYINSGQAQVIEANGFTLDLDSYGANAIWIDPARRLNGRRINNPDHWIPAFSTALNLARSFPAAGMKLAPGIAYDYLPADSHAEWISENGDLLEAVLWCGSAAQHTPRRAVLLRSAPILAPAPSATSPTNAASAPLASPTYWEADAQLAAAPVEFLEPTQLNQIICEPDDAIIRSGGISSFAKAYSCAPVSTGIAYLTGSTVPPPIYAQSYRVLAMLPLNAKKVGAYLREHGITRVEIKKRGTNVTPEAFRAQLKLNGTGGAERTVILTPVMGKHQAIIAQRITSSAL